MSKVASEAPNTSTSPILSVANIFRSVDGESTINGPLQWTTFVRLGGCNLRCWKSSGHCDAPHSLSMKYPYQRMPVDQINDFIRAAKTPRVTITGGEPMLQKSGVLALASSLRQTRMVKYVTLETSGSVAMTTEDAYYFSCVIADLKTPSTEMHKLLKLDYRYLRERDIIKVIVENEADLDWAVKYLAEGIQAQIMVSPRHGYVSPRVVLEWLQARELFTWGLNMQLHKYIWPEHVAPDVPDLAAFEVDIAAREKVVLAER